MLVLQLHIASLTNASAICESAGWTVKYKAILAEDWVSMKVVKTLKPSVLQVSLKKLIPAVYHFYRYNQPGL
jgi:hypothetical protein